MTSNNLPTAQSVGKINCLSCGSIATPPIIRCPNCNGLLYLRKKNTIQKTWIYLLTSIFLFFPANLLPITHTNYLSQPTQKDTIMSAIAIMWRSQSYAVATIIFLASVFTPFFKISVLTYLLLHSQPRKPPILQTKLYKIIHIIGRWSMIDVFVVSLLGALVHGRLVQISPDVGIFAFAGVVLLTMFATESFDIRTLWDNYYLYASRSSKT